MAGVAVKASNLTLEAFRIEALKRGLKVPHAYQQVSVLAGIPTVRLRGWLNGEYRLTPERVARVAKASARWLGDDKKYPAETIVRYMRESRAEWIEHEKIKLNELDGEWFAAALALYLKRPLPAPEEASENATEEG